MEQFIQTIFQGYESYGALYAVGAALAGSIGVFRTDAIQSFLPAKHRWEAWPKWLKRLAPFALSGAGSALTAAATGVSGAQAILAAGVTGAVATIQYRATKPPKPSGVRTSPTGLVFHPHLMKSGPPNIGGTDAADKHKTGSPDEAG